MINRKWQLKSFNKPFNNHIAGEPKALANQIAGSYNTTDKKEDDKNEDLKECKIFNKAGFLKKCFNKKKAVVLTQY